MYRPNMYNISIAARLIGLSPHTLRKWDTKGIYLARRDGHGRRWYNDHELVELRQLAATRKAGRPPKRKLEDSPNG